MTFDPDIATDYQSLDGLESFTLVQGASDPVAVNNCLRESLSFQDLKIMASGSLGTQPGDMVLNAWGPEFPNGVKPGLGDSFTDANNAGHVVQSLEYRPRTQRYRMIVRLKVVA